MHQNLLNGLTLEKDVQTAIHEYFMSYPVISDAQVNEAMKLEVMIPKAAGGVDTSMLSNDFANNAAQTAANTADTADSAGRIADSVDISKENLKYLRDIAETEAINRFTTAEIEVTMNNNNTVSSDMDIDGMVDHLSAGVLEAMEQAAEGVH